MPTSRIPETEQVELRRVLVEARAALLGRAAILCARLRPPTPRPEELVNEVSRRLLARYRDTDIGDARGLAFSSLGRLACDVARGYRFDAGVIDEPPEVAINDEPSDPFVRQFLAELNEQERCVLMRIAVHGIAVQKAFFACGWTTPSPHFEYRKLLKRLRDRMEATTCPT
jgi:DNA-directed RNA polymerase specialized sigma24 family protein